MNFYFISPPRLPPPIRPSKRPHPWLPGRIFTDHLCISYVYPVGEVRRVMPEQRARRADFLSAAAASSTIARRVRSPSRGKKKKEKEMHKSDHALRRCGRPVLQLTQIPNWMSLHKLDSLNRKHKHGSFIRGKYSVVKHRPRNAVRPNNEARGTAKTTTSARALPAIVCSQTLIGELPVLACGGTQVRRRTTATAEQEMTMSDFCCPESAAVIYSLAFLSSSSVFLLSETGRL